MSRPSAFVQGTLDLLILKILALEPLNGWAISLRLKQVSSDVLQVSDGSLYPALHKLEQHGWITAEWGPSENNRPCRRLQQSLFVRSENAESPCSFEIANHDCQWLAVTMLALPQSRDGGLAGRVHAQMKSADALDREHISTEQSFNRGHNRVCRFDGIAV